MIAMPRLTLRRRARSPEAIDAFVAGLRDRRNFLAHLPELPPEARGAARSAGERRSLRGLLTRFMRRGVRS